MPAEVPTTPIDGGAWLGDLPSRLLPRARSQWGVRGTLFPPVSQQAGPAGLSYTGDPLEPSEVSYHIDRARGSASVTPVTAYSPLATGNSAGPAVRLVTRVTDPLSGVAAG